MSEGRLPEFVIIGAAKAATTWLAYQLRVRPDVFLPGPEPHFFSREFERGEAYYRECFAQARDDQTVGEKSADYLTHPDAARRIAKMIPAAKLIVQLRNPIERAYSDYCMLYRRGTVGRDVEHYLRPPARSMPRFLDDGLYHRHLARFLEYFPRERIKVILHDDIRRRPETVMAETCAMLGLPFVPELLPLVARVNDRKAPLLPLFLRRALQASKSTVDPWRDRAWFKAVRATIARPVRYPPLTSDIRRGLQDYYSEDVARLSLLLNRDLGSWLGEGNAH